MQKMIAFFMAIIAFLMNLFGISPKTPGVTAFKDAAYAAASASQKLDFYLPESENKEIGLDGSGMETNQESLIPAHDGIMKRICALL